MVGTQSPGGWSFCILLGLSFLLGAWAVLGFFFFCQRLSSVALHQSLCHTQLSLPPLSIFVFFEKWKYKADGLILVGLYFLIPSLVSR